jgi:hypothetical protein
VSVLKAPGHTDTQTHRKTDRQYLAKRQTERQNLTNRQTES